MKTSKTRYWIAVASREHVQKGEAEGFAQACHGKAGPLKRMKKGDGLIYYSGKERMGEPQKCQQFTAIGKVLDEDVYKYQLSEDFCPARRNVDFLPSRPVSILPLIPDLSFITHKKYWGYPFRFGFFEIGQQDFDLIADQMLLKNKCLTQ